MRSICSGSRPISFGAIDLVDVGLDRLGRHEGLAEAGEALVGMDAQPEEVAELREPDRFERGDLHGSPQGPPKSPGAAVTRGR